MRIDTFNKISQLYQASKPRKTSGSVTESSLELSRTGNDFRIAKAAVQAAPDIRQEKVDAIKQQLASGTYSVSGQDIAEHLVERYLDLKA